jgi:hypothetical protein
VIRIVARAVRGEVAAGIIVPNNIIARPFAAPQKDARFELDDGLILLGDALVRAGLRQR